ncbi:hypothetical protein F7725_010420 [Dissostichus mawsoni]|uniref:Uncharacterized protein n=1 Tax=Dissostichus mawsoni TaxID=36200 RepID=A0A7J5XNH5_DISMA|nr:hypothetical protein F7725_010420 [Dissostichus mawsoni]
MHEGRLPVSLLESSSSSTGNFAMSLGSCPASELFNGILKILTLGREALEPELCVVIVSTVVMPRPTRAGSVHVYPERHP